MRYSSLSVCVLIGGSLANLAWSDARISETARNLLLDARISSNIESLDRGLRGGPDHMIFDLQQGAFAAPSQWHEYGVGFQAQLGIVGEEHPVWWMAQWPEPVRVNLLALSGTYDNQPQPTTGWKIEFRRDGRWMTHARGVGDWYDRGYYVWGGPGTESLTMDALRVSVFSRDDQTPIQSVHFRGEPGKSWIVAYCPPIAARIVPPDAPIRAAQPAEFSAVPLLGEIRSWSWDFGDEDRTDGRTVRHVFTRTGHVEVGLRFSDGEHTDRIRRTVTVLPPVEARIVPLTKASMAGQPVAFSAAGSFGSIREYKWDFGDGVQASGRETQHVFAKPGIYRVALTVTDGTYADTCLALVRVHTQETVGLPQLLLDTDAKNEQDDQHYLGYLKSIMPARNKALYDASCLSAIISDHLGLGWVKKTEPVIVAGPDQGYRWTGTAQPTPVQVIRQIDQQAMQRDLFESMQGRPTPLLGPVTESAKP